MKKKVIVGLILSALLMGVPTAKAWFGSSERERRIETEQRLVEEQKKTGGWEFLSFLLATGLGLVFIVGTAIGSKGRKDANLS